ncbi:TPA: hypothetical protein WID01_000128 [Neisseria meningitidis]|uniref:hypothetical protein n=1 Tax=Neisseria meningitidis TaxID=487 RepID=UPI000E5791AA|nr:hypothetical protein [Neisseria meningitidis]
MEGLINALKYLAEHEPIDNFEEIRTRNSPIELPSGLSNFEQNIFLKENLSPKLQNDDSLKTHYWIIREWGGIKSFKQSAENSQLIRQFLSELNSGKLSSGLLKISSLSKLASFINCERFAIYDSRAIFSLNWLLFKFTNADLFFQPQGRNRELEIRNMNVLFHFSDIKPNYRKPDVSFHQYCGLLQDLAKQVYGKQAKPYHIEMLLFKIATTWICADMDQLIKFDCLRNQDFQTA